MKFLRFSFNKASNAADTSPNNNNTSDLNISKASEAIEESPTNNSLTSPESHVTLTNPNASTSRATSLSTSSPLHYPSFDSDSNIDSFSDELDVSDPAHLQSLVKFMYKKICTISDQVTTLSDENENLRISNRQFSLDIDKLRAENVKLHTKIDNIPVDSPSIPERQSSDDTSTLTCDDKFDDLYSKLHSYAVKTQQDINNLNWKTQMKREVDIDNIYDQLDNINRRLFEAEKDINNTNQYMRRNNLVLNGIPDNIPQKDLQDTCADIIKKLGYLVFDNEIEGCHRLPKKGKETAPVIIRFTNRKVVEFVIKNRRNLSKIGLRYKVFATEDLNSSNERIKEECIKLQNMKLITKYTTWNGNIKVTVEPGDHSVRVSHLNELEEMFFDSYYYT